MSYIFFFQTRPVYQTERVLDGNICTDHVCISPDQNGAYVSDTNHANYSRNFFFLLSFAANTIRLNSGSTVFDNKNEGVVEVQIDGKWGPICGSDFDYREAKVICKQLGYSTYDDYHKDGKFWYDSVDTSGYDEAFYIGLSCDGDERSISECYYHFVRGPTDSCISSSSFNFKPLYAGLECDSVIYSEGKYALLLSLYGRNHTISEVIH